MMLEKKIVDLLQEQVNLEWYSAYFYLDIYGYYADKNLDGFANWFYVQVQEERDHAMMFVHYLLANGNKLALQDIKASSVHFDAFGEPLQAAFQHELAVTKSIHKIYEKAQEVKDFRTQQFLDWFVKEQGEEEKNIEDLVKKYALFGKDERGLYLLNTELASRAYAALAPNV